MSTVAAGQPGPIGIHSAWPLMEDSPGGLHLILVKSQNFKHLLFLLFLLLLFFFLLLFIGYYWIIIDNDYYWIIIDY